MKQGQSSTPADIVVDIFNPYNSVELGIELSIRISAGVDNWPCFITFYCYDPYWLLNYKISLHL